MEPDILTVRQAADLLGVSTEAVHHLLKRGRIPGQRLDGWMWVLKRDDVTAYQASQEGKGRRGPKPRRNQSPPDTADTGQPPG
jgi:excisionase family DNA binding protein